MAITKERKEEILETYRDWLKRSQAVILVEYTGANMKNMDAINKARPSGAKGAYIKRIVVNATMGPGIKVDPNLALSVEAAE